MSKAERQISRILCFFLEIILIGTFLGVGMGDDQDLPWPCTNPTNLYVWIIVMTVRGFWVIFNNCIANHNLRNLIGQITFVGTVIWGSVGQYYIFTNLDTHYIFTGQNSCNPFLWGYSVFLSIFSVYPSYFLTCCAIYCWYMGTNFSPETLDAFAYIMGIESWKVCQICHSEFIFSEEIKKLPCQHEFHINCITQLSCPTCPQVEGSVEGRSQPLLVGVS